MCKLSHRMPFGIPKLWSDVIGGKRLDAFIAAISTLCGWAMSPGNIRDWYPGLCIGHTLHLANLPKGLKGLDIPLSLLFALGVEVCSHASAAYLRRDLLGSNHSLEGHPSSLCLRR